MLGLKYNLAVQYLSYEYTEYTSGIFLCRYQVCWSIWLVQHQVTPRFVTNSYKKLM